MTDLNEDLLNSLLSDEYSVRESVSRRAATVVTGSSAAVALTAGVISLGGATVAPVEPFHLVLVFVAVGALLLAAVLGAFVNLPGVVRTIDLSHLSDFGAWFDQSESTDRGKLLSQRVGTLQDLRAGNSWRASFLAVAVWLQVSAVLVLAVLASLRLF